VWGNSNDNPVQKASRFTKAAFPGFPMPAACCEGANKKRPEANAV
jgi:hypothetical protein